MVSQVSRPDVGVVRMPLLYPEPQLCWHAGCDHRLLSGVAGPYVLPMRAPDDPGYAGRHLRDSGPERGPLGACQLMRRSSHCCERLGGALDERHLAGRLLRHRFAACAYAKRASARDPTRRMRGCCITTPPAAARTIRIRSASPASPEEARIHRARAGRTPVSTIRSSIRMLSLVSGKRGPWATVAARRASARRARSSFAQARFCSRPNSR
jgi:hypothetical protein